MSTMSAVGNAISGLGKAIEAGYPGARGTTIGRMLDGLGQAAGGLGDAAITAASGPNGETMLEQSGRMAAGLLGSVALNAALAAFIVASPQVGFVLGAMLALNPVVGMLVVGGAFFATGYFGELGRILITDRQIV